MQSVNKDPSSASAPRTSTNRPAHIAPSALPPSKRRRTSSRPISGPTLPASLPAPPPSPAPLPAPAPRPRPPASPPSSPSCGYPPSPSDNNAAPDSTPSPNGDASRQPRPAPHDRHRQRHRHPERSRHRDPPRCSTSAVFTSPQRSSPPPQRLLSQSSTSPRSHLFTKWFRKPSVVWYRGNDLRVEDHPALLAAAQRGGPVVPFFVWDPSDDFGASLGNIKTWWLRQSLIHLQRDLRRLGADLHFRVGKSTDELRSFLVDTGADAVFWNRCYEPELLRRDEELRDRLASEGFTAESFKAELLVEPWELSKSETSPRFDTFHSYMRAWMTAPPPPQPFPSPSRLKPITVTVRSVGIDGLGFDVPADVESSMSKHWKPGSAQAKFQLETFLRTVFPMFGEGRYRRQREGTSRLSPHIRFGELSPRRMYHATRLRVSQGSRLIASKKLSSAYATTPPQLKVTSIVPSSNFPHDEGRTSTEIDDREGMTSASPDDPLETNGPLREGSNDTQYAAQVPQRRPLPHLSQCARAFLKNLCLRDFACHILFHNPDCNSKPLIREFNQFPWAPDNGYFSMWLNGCTGYPIVDAAMRQLRATGWIHNTMRFLLACFLTRHLLLPWSRGLEAFYGLLIDGDRSSNALGWQWTAGSNNDAFPIASLVNPVKVAYSQDPSGSYVRRWLPELAKLPNEFLHEPWKAPAHLLAVSGVSLGSSYPNRIVLMSEARVRTQKAMWVMKKVLSESTIRASLHFPDQVRVNEWPEEKVEAIREEDSPSLSDKSNLLPSLWLLLQNESSGCSLPVGPTSSDPLIAIDTASLVDGALAVPVGDGHESIEYALLTAHEGDEVVSDFSSPFAVRMPRADVVELSGDGDLAGLLSTSEKETDTQLRPADGKGTGGSVEGLETVGSALQEQPAATEHLSVGEENATDPIGDSMGTASSAAVAVHPQPAESTMREVPWPGSDVGMYGQVGYSTFRNGATSRALPVVASQVSKSAVAGSNGLPMISAATMSELSRASPLAHPMYRAPPSVDVGHGHGIVPGLEHGIAHVHGHAHAHMHAHIHAHGHMTGSTAIAMDGSLYGMGGVSTTGPVSHVASSVMPSVVENDLTGNGGAFGSEATNAMYAHHMNMGAFYGFPHMMPMMGPHSGDRVDFVRGGLGPNKFAPMMPVGYGMYGNGLFDSGLMGAGFANGSGYAAAPAGHPAATVATAPLPPAAAPPPSVLGHGHVHGHMHGHVHLHEHGHIAHIGGSQVLPPGIHGQPQSMPASIHVASSIAPAASSAQAIHHRANASVVAIVPGGAGPIPAGPDAYVHDGAGHEVGAKLAAVGGLSAGEANVSKGSEGVLKAVGSVERKSRKARGRHDAGRNAASRVQKGSASSGRVGAKQQGGNVDSSTQVPVGAVPAVAAVAASGTGGSGIVHTTGKKSGSGVRNGRCGGGNGGKTKGATRGRRNAAGNSGGKGGGGTGGGSTSGVGDGSSSGAAGGKVGRNRGGGDARGSTAVQGESGPTNLKDREEVLGVILQQTEHEYHGFVKFLRDKFELTANTDRHVSKDYVRLCNLKDDYHKQCVSEKLKLKIYRIKSFFSKILRLEVTGEWDRHNHGGVRGPYVYGIRLRQLTPPQNNPLEAAPQSQQASQKASQQPELQQQQQTPSIPQKDPQQLEPRQRQS